MQISVLPFLRQCVQYLPPRPESAVSRQPPPPTAERRLLPLEQPLALAKVRLDIGVQERALAAARAVAPAELRLAVAPVALRALGEKHAGRALRQQTRAWGVSGGIAAKACDQFPLATKLHICETVPYRKTDAT